MGAQKNVFDIASQISVKGHTVFVATGKQVNDKDGWLFNKLSNFGFNKEKLHVFENLVREIRPIKDLRGFLDIYTFVKNNQFHIVNVHSTKAGILGGIASKLAGAKTIYTIHGFVFNEPMGLWKKLFYILAEYINSFFIDYYICVSNIDFDIGVRYNIIRKKRGKVIYNGINPDFNFLNTEESREKIIEMAKPNFIPSDIFGVVANLYATKGLSYLTDAAKPIIEKYPDKLFVIFGEGELRDSLENQIKSNHLEKNFKLLGFVDNAQTYLKGLDLLILSSVKEGLPYTLIEASLANIPILATKVGGIVEMSKLIEMNLINSKSSEDIRVALMQFIEKRNFPNAHFNHIFSKSKTIEQNVELYRILFSDK